MKRTITDDELVYMYTSAHLTMAEIGAVIGITRQGVLKRLRKLGVTAEQGERVEVACAKCGSMFVAERKRWRKQRKVFCSQQCYFQHIENPDYVPWRQGQSIARKEVSRYFDLKPEHVVHHKDGNNYNNDIMNLAVFASQADHMAYHRGAETPFLFDGASII